MIKITKKEAEFLLSKGLKFKDSIFKTYSGNGIYYCKEGYPSDLVNKYRESKTILRKS